jgi:DNA repair photolyase
MYIYNDEQEKAFREAEDRAFEEELFREDDEAPNTSGITTEYKSSRCMTPEEEEEYFRNEFCFVEEEATAPDATAENTKPVSQVRIEPTAVRYGTRELSETSMNSLVGCTNNCLYCFAAHNAVEKGFVRSRDAWAYEKIRRSLPDFNRKYSGRVMYPTNHDITPRNLSVHVQAVGSLLTAGNDMLICSKARFACIQAISEACTEHKDKVVFMITITSLDEAQSIFWEPNAPLPAERLLTLGYLHREGFKTSVLVEPLLQGSGSAIDIYNRVIDIVTDEIWFGTMNYVDTRVDMSNPDNAKAAALIKRYHSHENMRFLYESMADMPKVRFKRSILAMNENR